MNRKAFLAAAVLLFSCVGAGHSQGGMIKSRNGVLVVWNEPGNFFTVDIKGQKIAPIPDQALWFTVDGKFFQIVTAEKKQFLSGSEASSSDARMVLSKHMVWESGYLANMLQTKLEPVSSWVRLPNGTEALEWSIQMPKVKLPGQEGKQTAKKQLYLSVVKREHVLLVNTVVETDNEEKLLREFLFDTLSSMRSFDKAQNMQAIADAMKAN